MKTESRPSRLAVLIDADNASSKIAAGLFEEVAKLGEASVRRIYGDFSGTRLKSWADVLSLHAIRAQQNFAYTSGKNASDIALVIDAMDLLHSGRFDGFCLVSSDSDFTGLAARIREQGLDVYGFGEKKTPQSFRQACKRFIYTENLVDATEAATAGPLVPAEVPKVAAVPQTAKSAGAESVKEASKFPPSKARPLLKKAVEQSADESGWAHLTRVGQQALALEPDFDVRNYAGVSKLLELVTKAGELETIQRQDNIWMVKLKPPKGGIAQLSGK